MVLPIHVFDRGSIRISYGQKQIVFVLFRTKIPTRFGGDFFRGGVI